MRAIYVTVYLIFVLSIATAFSKKLPAVVAPSQPAAPVVIEEPSIPAPIETPVQADSRVALSWENTTEPHPERMPWSNEWIKLIKKDLAIYKQAKDWKIFCPKFELLDDNGKIKAIGELWVAMALYESGFKPSTNSVDVGNKKNKDTWSVGLYQMSVVDTANKDFKYSFAQLQQPIPNIHVAHTEMIRQIVRRGLLVVPNKPYWAVMYRGKFDKVDSIAARVKKHASNCK